MKARVKETGEIVEVHTCDEADFIDRQGRFYWEHQLYFGTLDDFDKDVPDYWTRLEHKYVGMAMQAMLTSPELMQVVTSAKELLTNEYAKRVAVVADRYATALVEKLKEEK